MRRSQIRPRGRHRGDKEKSPAAAQSCERDALGWPPRRGLRLGDKESFRGEKKVFEGSTGLEGVTDRDREQLT